MGGLHSGGTHKENGMMACVQVETDRRKKKRVSGEEKGGRKLSVTTKTHTRNKENREIGGPLGGGALVGC